MTMTENKKNKIQNKSKKEEKSDMKKKALNQLMTQFMQYQWNTFKSDAYPFEVLAHNADLPEFKKKRREGNSLDSFPTLS